MNSEMRENVQRRDRKQKYLRNCRQCRQIPTFFQEMATSLGVPAHRRASHGTRRMRFGGAAMKPIFLFIVVSTSATGALLVAMGSHVGLIVCVVAVGLYEWFGWSDTAQRIAVPRSDERHGVEDSTRPAALPVIRRTTGGAA